LSAGRAVADITDHFLLDGVGAAPNRSAK
jgi:hypothetical protein